MKNLNIHPSRQIEMPANAPIAAAILRPVLFTDQDVYYCVLGDNLHTAITGLGDTLEDALEDWEDTLKERVNADDQDDLIMMDALAELSAYRKKLSAENERAFMAQLRPVKR